MQKFSITQKVYSLLNKGRIGLDYRVPRHKVVAELIILTTEVALIPNTTHFLILA